MKAAPTNYIAYVDGPNGEPRIGHLDFATSTIQRLNFISGTPIQNLYQVIEAGSENVVVSGKPVPLHGVQVLPPFAARDVLAVGKNYAEHAKEFNRSGYDSSDKVDQPTHPVIFTKRATSIIANGEDIVLDPEFTQSLDYEGEIGVIIGKPGFKIPVKKALDYVWGYTIINDVTARERQRDHKQFYTGKSGDTYCPMGPIAVSIKDMPEVLGIKTAVNGEERQMATTADLIFSIPYLIKTLSEGQTLQAGDVLATGTPAGVGIGKSPPVFLKDGDEVEISVTNLGTLRNRVVSLSSATKNGLARHKSQIPVSNNERSLNESILTRVGDKALYYKRLGKKNGPPIVFIHGLGGSVETFRPVISCLSLEESNSLHLLDLEGHGLSPSSALSAVSIESFALDVKGVCDFADITPASPATIIAHSMGCLVAIFFALQNPGFVKKLILLGPPPTPISEATSKALLARAETVRNGSMTAIADAVVSAGTSDFTKVENPVALAAARLSLLGQSPEGYAKGCMALAGARDQLAIDKLDCHTLIVTGDEDRVSTVDECVKYASMIPDCQSPVVLKNAGHWHTFEDPRGVANALCTFLQSTL